MGKPSRYLLLVAIACAGVIAIVVAGTDDEGGAASGFDPGVEIRGIHPAFDPAERLYVARCGPPHPPIEVRAEPGVTVRTASGPLRGEPARLRPDVVPGDDFSITIAEGGSSRAYRVRCLPADFPRWHFNPVQRVEDDLFVVSFKPSPRAAQWVVAFDTRGVPRWWYRPGKRVLWAQILSDGTVTMARAFGDGYGQDPRMAHEVRTTSGELLRLVRARGSIIDGHELIESGRGGILVATYVPERADLSRVGGPRRAAIVTAEIQELDRRGRLRWRWNSGEKVALRETRLRWWARILANPRERLGGLQTFDPVHINAIETWGDDRLIVSARHTDGVYGISRESGEILWKLGGRGTDRSLKVIGDPAGRHLFGGQHDARISPNGTLSVYDNGKLRKYDSRVVLYRLQPGRRMAHYLGKLDDPLVETSHCCGSARRLPAGGWLVNWGSNPLITGFDDSRRIAFRLRLPTHAYRAVPVPDGAVTLAELDRSLERMVRDDDLSPDKDLKKESK